MARADKLADPPWAIRLVRALKALPGFWYVADHWPWLAAYLAAAATSFASPWLAVILCAVVVGAAAWRDPDISLFLFVVALPFDRLFHVPEDLSLVLLAAQLVIQVGALARRDHDWLRRLADVQFWKDRAGSGVWLAVVAFVLIAVVHSSPRVDDVFRLKSLAFGGGALLLMTLYDGQMSRRTRDAVISAIIVAALLQIVVDKAFVLGLRPLFSPPQSLPFDPVVKGRLMGFTLNPNDLAEYLLAAFCLVYAAVLTGEKQGWGLKLVLAALLFAGVADTASKGALIASLVVLTAVAIGLVAIRLLPRAGLAAGLAVMCLAIVVAVDVAPPLLGAQVALPPPPTPRAGPAPPCAAGACARPGQSRIAQIKPLQIFPRLPKGGPPPNSLERRLRIGVELRPSPDADHGRLTFGQVIVCRGACGGLRAYLWPAGWSVVRAHWLTGIGYGGWPFTFEQLVGQPYSSPHNATLHMWGMFGVVGLLLNLAFYGVLIGRMTRLVGSRAVDPQTLRWAVGAGLFGLIMMGHELVETSLMLSLSRIGLFTWIVLALQSSLLFGPSGAEPARGSGAPSGPTDGPATGAS